MAADGFRTRSRSICSAALFTFEDNAYFVDVVITKSGAGGTPALQVLQVEFIEIC